MARDSSLVVALVCLAACSTYDDSLRLGPLGSAGGSVAAGAPSSAGRNPGRAGSGASVAGSSGSGGEAGEDAGSAGSESGDAGSTTSTGGAGSGGEVGGGVSGGGTSDTAGSGPLLELLDDFEDQDGFVLPLHKRNGPWYVFSDATGGELAPLTIAPLTGAPSHAGSTMGLHLVASGFSDWGVGVGADLVNTAGKKVAYDVSAYRGIRFYAKVASGAQTMLKVLVPTVYSDPEGGKCSDAVSSKRCSDHLFRTVTGLRPTWDQYEVDFDDLTQQGFGLPQASLDASGVYSIQFTQSSKLLPVDLWLDDVSFVVR